MTYSPRSTRRLATILLSTGLAAILAMGTVLAGTPVTNGYRDHGYGGGAFRPSGDKPQSKLWYTDEGGGAVQWWAGMFRYSTSPSISDYRIYKLSADKTDLTATTTVVDARDSSHGDYLWDETTNTLYVASVVTPNASDPFAVPTTPDGIRVFKYSYNNATDTYTAAAGFPKTIQNTSSTASPQFRGGSWTVTIAKDSTDRLWMAWPKVNDVLYSTSIDDGATWTDPAVIPAQGVNTINTGTLSHSDSAAVIAFGNGSPSTVGVMWSDQDGLPLATDNGYYFATIAAGADPTLAGNWTKVELPKLAGLTNDESDNHINMKATSDGRVFMVGKARTDTVACATNKQRPLVPFFARTAGGAWSTHLAGTVGDCNTRPQVVISEQLDVAYLLMTSPNGGGAVYSKSAPLSGANSFVFRGAADQTIQRGTPFIRSATETLIDDPSTTKQPVTDASGIVAIANNLTSSAGGNVKVFLHNSMAIPATDSTDPAGSVSINGGAGATSSSTVSVAVPATDTGGSGVSLVRLSNAADMSGSTTFVYTTPIAWTLTAGLGVKTVYVQWRDAAGNWSATASDDITVTSDTTAPTTPGIPTQSICCSGATGFPIRVSWTASSDPESGIDHYELYMSVNGAVFAKVGDTTATSHNLVVTTSSSTYRFAVRAVNGENVPGSFRYGPTFRTISYSESSSAVSFSSGWGLSSSTDFVGGKAKYSVTAGRSATLTFNGNRVAWLSPTGPNMGSARVYINGTLTSTVNLFSATSVARKLVFTRTWSTTATRTIRIVVVGTAGHPRVIVDQLYVLR